MNDPTTLDDLDELDRWLERSRREPVWIFKHSLACGISDGALQEFREFAADAGAVPWAMIEVQRARRVSDELSRRSGVRHESPQALLLRDGRAVWHASHWHIRAGGLRRAADSAV